MALFKLNIVFANSFCIGHDEISFQDITNKWSKQENKKIIWETLNLGFASGIETSGIDIKKFFIFKKDICYVNLNEAILDEINYSNNNSTEYKFYLNNFNNKYYISSYLKN